MKKPFPRRAWQKLCATIPLLLTLAACAPTVLLNMTVPRSGYTLNRNIPYGDNPRQKLDIYVPDRPNGTVVMFFYGGSWQTGNKEIYRFVGQALASRGYVAVLPDYRLYPEVSFPAFVDDGAHAVAWVHKHIGDYHGNPNRLFVTGHSAGAYIAVMLALNEKYLTEVGGSPDWLNGVIGLAGPYDFLPFTDPKIIALFSTAPDKDTQPITYARPNTPPMLLLTGTGDQDVWPKNTRNLAAKLTALHDSVEVHEYPGLAHTGIVLSLSGLFRGKAPVLDDMDGFIRKCSDSAAKP